MNSALGRAPNRWKAWRFIRWILWAAALLFCVNATPAFAQTDAVTVSCSGITPGHSIDPNARDICRGHTTIPPTIRRLLAARRGLTAASGQNLVCNGGNCAVMAAASEPTWHANAYTSSSTWTLPSGVYAIDALIVGGGGGGGSGGSADNNSTANSAAGSGGGGGGGGYIGYYSDVAFTGNVTVTIGSGGGGGTAVSTHDTQGNAGSNGTATTLTDGTVTFLAPGGAAGGPGQAGDSDLCTISACDTGGSDTANFNCAGGSGGAGESGGNCNGYNGTNGASGSAQTCSFGTNASASSGGTGGAGNNADTCSGFGGGGGGGGGGASWGAGGAGGAGGKYNLNNAGAGTAASANTGGGGGGGGGGGAEMTTDSTGAGGTGGSGYVIIWSLY